MKEASLCSVYKNDRVFMCRQLCLLATPGECSRRAAKHSQVLVATMCPYELTTHQHVHNTALTHERTRRLRRMLPSQLPKQSAAHVLKQRVPQRPCVKSRSAERGFSTTLCVQQWVGCSSSWSERGMSCRCVCLCA